MSWIKDIVRHNEVRIKETYKLSATQIKEPETLPIEEFRKVLIDCLNGTTSMTVDFKTIFVNFNAKLDTMQRNGYVNFAAFCQSYEKEVLKTTFRQLDENSASNKLDDVEREKIMRHQILKSKNFFKDPNNETAKYLLSTWMTREFPTFQSFKDAVSEHYSDVEAHFAKDEKLGGLIKNSMYCHLSSRGNKGQSKASTGDYSEQTCHMCGNRKCWYKNCKFK